MKDILFYTFCSDFYQPIKHIMVNSFRHFHPEYELRVIEGDELKSFSMEQNVEEMQGITSTFGRLHASEYSTLVHIDIDSIILGRLDEVFTKDYEVAGTLNNSVIDPKISCFGVSDTMYLNYGFTACRSSVFWEVLDYTVRRTWRRFPFWEQDIYNILFYGLNNKIEVLDTYAWYGCSSRGRWKEMQRTTDPSTGLDKIMLDHKQVKIVHWAGGQSEGKLNYHDSFSPDVAAFVDSIL